MTLGGAPGATGSPGTLVAQQQGALLPRQHRGLDGGGHHRAWAGRRRRQAHQPGQHHQRRQVGFEAAVGDWRLPGLGRQQQIVDYLHRLHPGAHRRRHGQGDPVGQRRGDDRHHVTDPHPGRRRGQVSPRQDDGVAALGDGHAGALERGVAGDVGDKGAAEGQRHHLPPPHRQGSPARALALDLHRRHLVGHRAPELAAGKAIHSLENSSRLVGERVIFTRSNSPTRLGLRISGFSGSSSS